MANLLTDLSLTSAHDFTADTFEDITGMSDTVTIAGTGSVVLLMMSLTPTQAAGTGDSCVDLRFTEGGSQVGAIMSVFADSDDPNSEIDGATMMFALTGLSTGSHTFAVQGSTRKGDAIIDEARIRTFQIVEIETGASILVDLETLAADASPAAWANMTDLSDTQTPSAGSVLIFNMTVQLESGGADSANDFRFAVDGTRDGPQLSDRNDAVDELNGVSMVWAADDISATSQVFSVQWQQRDATPDMDESRERIFQVIEIFADADLLVDIESVTADTATGSYTDQDDMVGSPDIDSTDSIALVFWNFSMLADNGDHDVVFTRFEVDGVQQGAELVVFKDGVDLVKGSLMARAVTGESGVTDFAGQWINDEGTGETDTGRPRTFQVIDLKVAVAGDMAASLDIVLAVAADLDAQGKLDAALNIVLAQAADLTAAGRLDAALPIILAVIADLKGAGELTAVQSIVLTIAADLTAVGSLNAAALIALTVAADLDAIGEIQAALAIVLTVAAELDAPGTLSAALGIVLTVVADLTAAGELRAAADIVLTVVADLTEADRIDLQAALDIVLTVAADLDAKGRLDAALNIVLAQAADLTAAGRLDAALPIILQVIADLKGAGELTAAQSIVLTVAADLTATGSLDATLDIILAVAADLDAVGRLTANMQIVLAMAADLKAAGELRAALGVVLTVVADLSRNDLAAALLIRVTIAADLTEAEPEAPIEGGSPGAPPGPPTVTLTEQQVVQRQLLREDDEAMSVVLTALGLIRK